MKVIIPNLNQLTSNGFLKTTLWLCLSIVLLLSSYSATAFKPKDSGKEGTHAWMVKQAIKGKCSGCWEISVSIPDVKNPTDENGNKRFKEFTFSDEGITSIENADAAVDDGLFSDPSPDGEFNLGEAHCDAEELSGCSKRISLNLDDEESLIKKLVEQLKSGNGAKARKSLGRTLHTLQDFYAHSNWVNLGNKTPNSQLINGKLANPSSSKDFCQTNPRNYSNEGIFVKGLKTTDVTTGYFPPLSYFATPVNYNNFILCQGLDTCWRPPLGKCGHGIEEMATAHYRPGIAKDTAQIDTSQLPIYDMKDVKHFSQARDLAVIATNNYINQVLEAIKDEFGNDAEKWENAIKAFMKTTEFNIVVPLDFSLDLGPLYEKVADSINTTQQYYTLIKQEASKTSITSNAKDFKKAIDDNTGKTSTVPNLKLPYPAGKKWIVTSGYNADAHLNYSSPTEQDSYGLDFALPGCESWDEPVLAVAGGTVISTNEHKDYGKTVLIDHGNGLISRYAHLKSFSVSEKKTVIQGQEIGRVGNSGNVTGSACPEHPGVNLHLSMYHNGKAYKPEPMDGYINFNVGIGYPAKAKNTRRFTRDGNRDTDCSKPIMHGLYNAIAAQQTPGPIYLFTDSSAKDAELANVVIAAARAKNQSIYTVVTDKCTPDMKANPVLLRVTKETGGQLFQVSQSGEELMGFFDLIKSLTSEEYEPLLIIQDELADSEKNYSFPVDSSVDRLTLSVAMAGDGASHLLRPSGEKVLTTDSDVTVTELTNGQIIQISEPETGKWTLQATGNSSFSASVMGHTELQLNQFNFVEVRGRPLHQGEFPIHGQPIANVQSMINADVSGSFSTVEFELRSENGDFLKRLEMISTSENTFSGKVNLPSENGRIYLKGTDTNGLEFLRAFPALWLGKSVKVEPVASDRELIVGQSYQVSFRITNLGSSDTFTLVATNNRGLLMSVTPNRVTLNTDESAVVNVTLEVPNDTAVDNSVNMTLLAESDTTPENNNHFTFEAVIDSDSDGDGVSDSMEQGRLGSKTTYDGNGDGVPDYQQSNVTSLRTFDYWEYVTLETSEGRKLNNVLALANPSLSETPANMAFPLGLFSFSIEGITSGGTANVTLFADWPMEQYLIYGATPDNSNAHWYDFAHDGVLGATFEEKKVSVTFVDGAKGDGDLNANGVIKVLGGTGKVVSIVGPYKVSGHIYDKSDNPIAGVAV
ncbi:MAG: peptidoglycan DD-metalloendopeptidase family protein, partial [Candidatus Parabeggiatoa sp.]|nr:peptidoglycan DD-metalloendopeptidase family protein [Candidatus Parabeggiatoa sp.]